MTRPAVPAALAARVDPAAHADSAARVDPATHADSAARVDFAAEAHAPLTPPAIGVRAHSATPAATLDAVLWGIEEEGVPALVERSAQRDPALLAHQGAQASRLGVGVGLSGDRVAVTIEKLPPGRPYLAAELTNPARQGRDYGANAARLVRRVPLKPVDKE
ncbi:MAG: glycerol dehydratase reactivase beta/small subunit family protein [Actinomycetia bacterium]|nr:glycerol dehydratase reactivase beta/small subunit family protein [Actinomycetes bacterium]